MDSKTLEMMRSKIIDQYSNPEWRDRVRAMKPNQVIAIYQRMLNSGYFDRGPVAELRKGRNDEKPAEQYHQMTIFDYI